MYRHWLWNSKNMTCITFHRFKVFENRVLRTVFAPTGDQVRRSWRQLQAEELHNLHSSKKYYGIGVPKPRRVR
jgi:hypothetical protein